MKLFFGFPAEADQNTGILGFVYIVIKMVHFVAVPESMKAEDVLVSSLTPFFYFMDYTVN